jgi:hypothetical protein
VGVMAEFKQQYGTGVEKSYEERREAVRRD